MGFLESVENCIVNYFNFADRAPRSEFWFWILFGALVTLGLDGIWYGIFPETWGKSGIYGVNILGTLFSLVILIPSLAVGTRRLHDIDRTGWWQLLWLVPVIGWIVLVIWACLPGHPGANRFGYNPL